MKRWPVLTICLMLAWVTVPAQDTVTVMHYNLLHYGNTTTFCTQSNNNINDKAQSMALICHHINPHILTVNEMGANSFAHNHFLNNVLNINGINYFQGSTLTNVSGDNITNFLYYDARKFVLYKEHVLGTDVRDISIYTLYYNDPDLWKHHDTTFLVVMTTHLKAGNTTSDRAIRAATTAMLMDSAVLWSGLPALFSGDFNFYTANEQGYKNLTQPADTTVERFHDPIQQEGAWQDNPLFAHVHTQSTHASSNGCAAGGGLDDRFDFILINEVLKHHSSRFAYLPNSYYALGNDGNHLNLSINDGPNNSAPPQIIQALYDASDHLPVVMQLVINTPVGIRDINKISSFTSIKYHNNQLEFTLPQPATLQQVDMYDLTGRLVATFQPGNYNTDLFAFPLPLNTPASLLIIRAMDNQGNQYRGKVLTH
jgi:hypothetical protein